MIELGAAAVLEVVDKVVDEEFVVVCVEGISDFKAATFGALTLSFSSLEI